MRLSAWDWMTLFLITASAGWLLGRLFVSLWRLLDAAFHVVWSS